MTEQKPASDPAEYDTVAIIREKGGVRKDALFVLAAFAMFTGWLLGIVGYTTSESSLSVFPILIPVIFSIALVAGTDWYSKRYPGAEAVIASGALVSAGIITTIGLMMMLSNGDNLSATPYSFVLLSLFFPLVALTTNRVVVDITYRLGMNATGKKTIDHIDTLYVRSRGEVGYALAPEADQRPRVQAYVEAVALSEDRQIRDYSQVVKNVGVDGIYQLVGIDLDALHNAPVVEQHGGDSKGDVVTDESNKKVSKKSKAGDKGEKKKDS